MKHIKTWHERCEEHPDHQERIISERMIQARMQEEIDELRQALETNQEPFEYWSVAEGWVKIDEVREHFDSVGCGTIYKSGGEGRSPLYTAPPKKQWVGLTDEEIAQGPQEVFPALYGRWGWAEKEAFEAVVAWAEAKLKDKNHG
jgi:hypothetical protein